MPLVGIIDPSHYERRHNKWGRLPVWLPIEQVLLELKQENPKWSPWTYELAAALVGEHQERGDRISVTTLTAGCPRNEILKRKADYIGALDDEYLALRGTMVHRTLETYSRPEAIAEARFYVTVDGIEISGSPDLITMDTVYDYKVTDSPPRGYYAYRHHTEQLQYNAFIARHAEKWDLPEGVTELPFDPREHPVRQAVVVYLNSKGPELYVHERKETIITPGGKEREVNRPYIWTDEEVLEGDRHGEAGLRTKLHLMEEALRTFPDWVPGAEEVWGGEEGWKCPGPPLCYLPRCLAQRYPDGLMWENEEDPQKSKRRGRK